QRVSKSAQQLAQPDVAGHDVLDVLAHVPPLQRGRELGQLGGLASVANVVSAVRMLGRARPACRKGGDRFACRGGRTIARAYPLEPCLLPEDRARRLAPAMTRSVAPDVFEM